MSMEENPESRRIRIVCISDTHNTFPQLPQGDVLIHAGDLTNQGTFSELQKTVKWLEKAPFESKVVIAGNHDITLDSTFYKQYGSSFHNQNLQDTEGCIRLLTESSSITYLNHESKTIRLVKHGGPQTTFKVFGSPYSPSQGLWAFGYAPENAVALWDQIPLDSDIVVTHTPPKYHADEKPGRGAAGCEALRQALWRVRPRLAVCGHVHEGRGAESVLWDLMSPYINFKEKETFYWQDATTGTKKQFRIDLTSRSQHPLRNNAAVGDTSQSPHSVLRRTRGREIIDMGDASSDKRSEELEAQLPKRRSPPRPPFPGFEAAERPVSPTMLAPATTLAATRGLGGLPSIRSSGKCDVEVLSGREGREETCIINAAILASSWPHTEGKRFNKPTVVDLDLPIGF